MDLNIIDCQSIRELASCNAEFYSAIVNSLLEQFPHMLASVFYLQIMFMNEVMYTDMYTVLYGFKNRLTWQ